MLANYAPYPPRMGAEPEAMTMPFGPHRGQPITDLPTRFLEWVVKDVSRQDWPDLVAAAEEELKFRDKFSESIAISL